MTGALALARRLFDALYSATADATDTKGVYADTRSTEGLYSITNTQSAESTYAAGESTERDYVSSETRATTAECEDPATCSYCGSTPSGD